MLQLKIEHTPREIRAESFQEGERSLDSPPLALIMSVIYLPSEK